ncbi:hypothetical protein DPMN_094978 [Dreissena polymorpha]|uniref:Uncharacterized protein n=1 Tax=Dreissena polymorpha TaxID=45954 RepID=A0A9D4L731_DREPO|nr:hypothetical protein DPMN_094978 [Dreissena polymorpha]
METDSHSKRAGKSLEIEKLQQSDATLIISVIGNIKTENTPNDISQDLLSSLAEIADSTGTWIISFDNKREATEFLRVKQTSFNAREKTIQYCEATDVFLGQHDKTSVHSETRSFLLVTDNSDNEHYKDRYDVSNVERSVVIVVGGGIAVLKTVHRVVTHGIPVVVVQGSGSVADCIAKGHNHDSSETFAECMKSREEAKQFTMDTKNTCGILLKEILSKETTMNIYNRLERNDIRETILFAIKKAQPRHPKSQLLSLAWRWNKFDFADKEILSENSKYKDAETISNDIIRDTLFATLANDQADFVKVLLDKDLKANTTAFLNICTLQELYIEVLGHNTENDTMKMFIQNQLHWKPESKQTHTKVYCRFNQEHSKTDKISNRRWSKKEDSLISQERSKSAFDDNSTLSENDECQHKFDLILRVGRLVGAQLIDADMSNPYPHQNNQRPIGFTDLFLFAVIFNRQQLGEILWGHCQDKLGAALVASSILKTFYKTAKRNLELELSSILKDNSRNYEQKTVELLTECYKQDKKMARNLLIKNLEEPFNSLTPKNLEEPFHSLTPLALVDKSFLKVFMGHECCQTKLNLIWRGQITTHTSWWKILLALFMPFFVFGINFYTNERPFKTKTFCGEKKGDFKSVFITQENTEDKSDEHAEPSGDTKQKTNKVCPSDPSDELTETCCSPKRKKNKENTEDKSDEHAEPSGDTKQKTNKVRPSDPSDPSHELTETCCSTKRKTNKVSHEDQWDEIEFQYYLNIKKDSSKTQVHTVGMLRNEKDGVIQIFDALYYLYTAPFSVYTFNMVSYVIFMFYFSYFIIVDLDEETSFKEYTIWGWAATMAFEEMRQLITHRTPGLFSKIKAWIGSHWNKFDMLINILFITTVALRFNFSGDDFQYVRFLYSITVAMYYMRFLQAFLVAKNVGPKVIMIRKMMKDLLSFLGIFMVFFVSFSVMYQANLYPNSPPSASLLKKLVYKPYWQIFGELFLDEISGDEYGDCTTNSTVWKSAGGKDRCPENTRLVIYIGAIYIILTQIVLVNLLIAVLSNTYTAVHEKSDHIWKFYWYGIVREYYERPALCPPLIILVHIYRTIRHGVKRCQDRVSDNEFRLYAETQLRLGRKACVAEQARKALLDFADAAFKRYMKNTVKDGYTQT